MKILCTKDENFRNYSRFTRSDAPSPTVQKDACKWTAAFTYYSFTWAYRENEGLLVCTVALGVPSLDSAGVGPQRQLRLVSSEFGIAHFSLNKIACPLFLRLGVSLFLNDLHNGAATIRKTLIVLLIATLEAWILVTLRSFLVALLLLIRIVFGFVHANQIGRF